MRELIEGDLNRITPFDMVTAAENGDGAIREAIVEAARYLGTGVANVITTLHPDLVVLGGGVAKMCTAF